MGGEFNGDGIESHGIESVKYHQLNKQQTLQEISNGRTHGPRTPKKPEYLIALS